MFALSLRRTTLPLLGLVISVLALAGVAAAQYPPVVGSGRVSRSTVKQCQCTQFTGDGFAPGETVAITDNGADAGTLSADRNGTFRLQVCFDAADGEGRHELRGRGAAREVVASVDVRGDACRRDEVGSGNFGRLPRTGTASAAAALLTGFGLVTSGSAAMYAARRRRHFAEA